jgi:hypothetical protein
MKYRIRGRALSNLTAKEHTARVELAEAIARRWLDSGIRYAVINGLDKYPSKVGRDIDIIIMKRDCATAINDAISVSRRLGWNNFLARNIPYGLYQVTFIDGGISLQLDLMYGNLNWLMGTITLTKGVSIFANCYKRGTFNVSQSGTDLKGIRPLYYSHRSKLAEKLPFWVELLQSQRAEAYRALFGEKIFLGFRRAVFSGLPALQEWQKSFRVKLLTRHLIKHPISSLVNVLRNLRRRACLYIKNAPPVIAVVGPDGVGKSTTIRITSEWLGRCGLDVGVKHWRPGLLPSLASFTGRKNPQPDMPVAPRREKGGMNAIRLFYYWLDFVLGHWLKERYPLESGEFHLIIYDRCALDMSVDPLRYGLSSSKGAMLLYKLIPKPDLTIHLRDTPERIFKRKPELEPEEIRSQLTKWEKHRMTGYVDTVIDVTDLPDVMGRKLGQVILDFLGAYYSLKKSGLEKKIVNLHGFSIPKGFTVDRMSLPNSPLPAKRVGMQLYTPNTFKARFAWAVVRSAEKIGAGSLFVRKSSEPSVRLGDFDWRSWLGNVGGLLNNKRIIPAFYFPPQVDRHKCGIMLMDRKGEAVAFAKMGWDKSSRGEIDREVSGLKFCSEHSFKTFKTPKLLHRGAWDGRDYAIYTLLPQINGRAPANWNRIYLHAWEELKEKTEKRVKLNQLDWWSEVRNLGQVWKDAVEFIVHSQPEEGYRFCAVHGDFILWNARTAAGELWLFDWEEFSHEAPALVDPITFILKYEMLLKKHKADRVAREICKSLQKNIGRNVLPQQILLALAYLQQLRHCYAPHDLDPIVDILLEYST